jgi:hypothetical protein
MEPEVAGHFSEDRVCIRGISEQEPIQIYVTASVEITPADREPMAPSKYAWGDPVSLEVEKIRELRTYGFYLPRAPRSYEKAGVYVQLPVFDKLGKRSGDVTHLMLPGDVEEHPNGVTVYISMKRVIESIKDVPASTTMKIVGIIRKTNVTFTPYCGPAEDD